MKLPMAALAVLAAVATNAAEFEQTIPRRVSDINEKTLLANVWPGMTIKQAMQILGEPEEIMKVQFSQDASAPAIRYGIYWLIPAQFGSQIECIIHQKGLKTSTDKALPCGNVAEKYRLRTQ